MAGSKNCMALPVLISKLIRDGSKWPMDRPAIRRFIYGARHRSSQQRQGR